VCLSVPCLSRVVKATEHTSVHPIAVNNSAISASRMKKDEVEEEKDVMTQNGSGLDDFAGHGHVGSKKKRPSVDNSGTALDERGSQEGEISGDKEGGSSPRLSRRHTLAHLSPGRSSRRSNAALPTAAAGGASPSIFDVLGEGEGLEGLVFTASSAFRVVSRDLSMSPFSRIRNDLEQFVEESDRDLEQRFMSPEGTSQTQSLKQGHAQSQSPLVGPPVYSAESAKTCSRSVWIGGLDREATEGVIREAFGPYGHIQGVKLLDGYAFVRYERASEAAAAIAGMNGRVLGRTVIRTGPGREETMSSAMVTDSHSSSSVWVGTLPLECDEKLLHRFFAPFGPIESIKLVPGKRCAFVNYSRSEHAALAVSRLDRRLQIGEDQVCVGYARHASQQASAMQYMAPRRLSTGSMQIVGLPNPSRIDMSLPGETHPSSSLDSLRTLFAALDPSKCNGDASGYFTSAILTPAHARTNEELPDQAPPYCWPLPDLPPVYFGPELTPGRIRDYRRYVESQSCKPSEFDLIAMEIVPVIIAASTDPVGNVLVQKLIERGSDELKAMIIDQLAPYMASVGVHKNGTWVVQKLINWCSQPSQVLNAPILLTPLLTLCAANASCRTAKTLSGTPAARPIRQLRNPMLPPLRTHP